MNTKQLRRCIAVGLIAIQMLVLPVFAVSHNCPAATMTDVPANAWYHGAVDWVIVHGLMSGFSATSFGPDETLTRAQVVQVLYNKEGKPALAGQSSGFSDVPDDQWYTKAVTWASSRDIVSGYGGGIFKPDAPVTLEQVFVILWNYEGNPPLTGDADAVGPHSEWAGNAIGWAQAVGLMDNMPFDRVTDPATRAQTAQMLMNLLR
ncbi:MAG: S-layer homology domain-containing protein [Oscillospiraceae bacterium]|nr:S-layer homology domain-containing protein [Oscillospiraceae bacterium]